MNKKLKKAVASLSLGAMLLGVNPLVANATNLPNANANTNAFKNKLTSEQQEVLNSFLNEKEQTENTKMRASYRASFKRGSALMWSRDNIDFSTSSGKISSSKLWQESGFIFPNIVRVKGGTRYQTTSTLHKWRATKTMGAGIVSPWGDVTVYNSDVTDYYGVTGKGTGIWY